MVKKFTFETAKAQPFYKGCNVSDPVTLGYFSKDYAQDEKSVHRPFPWTKEKALPWNPKHPRYGKFCASQIWIAFQKIS